MMELADDRHPDDDPELDVDDPKVKSSSRPARCDKENGRDESKNRPNGNLGREQKCQRS